MALIKCPECKKDLSDSAKKCPHCGYINKKESKILEKIKYNKKLQIILGIAVFLMVLIVILIMVLGKDRRNAKKFIKHLESVGYSCSNYECKRTTGTKLEILEVSETLSVVRYTIESEDEYSMYVDSMLYTDDYIGDRWQNYITVKDKYYNENCYFVPTYYNDYYHSFIYEYYWKVGDNSRNTNKCSYDFTEKVNAMLREFESYYKSTDLKLGK